MRLDPTAVMIHLFQDIHPVHVKTLLFRLRCLSHRLMCFGFENYINNYEPRQLVLLASIMAQQQHDFLAREAHERGDEELQAWLEKAMPHLFKDAA